MGKPIADKGEICPLHRKDVSKVCHKCPWYIFVRGSDPQTDKQVETWGCSISWLPTLILETAKETRQTAAATESFRNEWAKSAANPIELIRMAANGTSPERIKDGREPIKGLG